MGRKCRFFALVPPRLGHNLGQGLHPQNSPQIPRTFPHINRPKYVEKPPFSEENGGDLCYRNTIDASKYLCAINGFRELINARGVLGIGNRLLSFRFISLPQN